MSRYLEIARAAMREQVSHELEPANSNCGYEINEKSGDKTGAPACGQVTPAEAESIGKVLRAFSGTRLVEIAPKSATATSKTATAKPAPPAWRQASAPDSRRPLTPPPIRAKIEAIEPEARRLGWPPELLWNASFWDLPRGLAAVLDPGDEIVEVTSEIITVLKTRHDLLRFARHAG